MTSVHSYLNFAGNTEEAFNFYSRVFGVPIDGVVRFRDMGGESMGISGPDLEKVANIGITLPGGTLLMGTDALESIGQRLTQGNNYYIYVESDSPEEARRLFEGLADGGSVEMDLQRTEWAELYGSLRDRYGVQWMVSYTGEVNFQAPQS